MKSVSSIASEKKRIDSVIYQYNKGLYSVTETFNMITNTIQNYISLFPDIDINDKIQIENNLYSYGLSMLAKEIKRINRQ